MKHFLALFIISVLSLNVNADAIHDREVALGDAFKSGNAALALALQKPVSPEQAARIGAYLTAMTKAYENMYVHHKMMVTHGEIREVHFWEAYTRFYLALEGLLKLLGTNSDVVYST